MWASSSDRTPATSNTIGTLIEPLEGRRMLAASTVVSGFNFGAEDIFTGATSVATDSAGNHYITGTFAFRINMNPAKRHPVLLRSGNYKNYHVLVAKYDPTGRLLWAKSFGGNDKDVGNVIRVSGDAVYVGGTFKNVGDFGGVKLTSRGNRDVFVMRLDAATGNTVWAESLGGTFDDYLNTLAIGPNNDLYIAGTARLNAVLDPKGGPSITTRGVDDTFIEKLDATDGKMLWNRAYGESDTLESAYGLVPDGKGGVYVAGTFYRTVQFDRSNSRFDLTASGRRAVYFGRLDDKGNWALLNKIDGKWAEAAALTSAPGGDLVITGRMEKTVTFGPGAKGTVNSIGKADAFVARYRPNGDFVWVRHFGGDGDILARGVAVDSKGNIFATGYFFDKTIFGPGKGGTLNTNKASDAGVVYPGPGLLPFSTQPNQATDAYIAKLDGNGKLLYAKQIGGDDGAIDPLGIAVDHSGNPVITGTFYGIVNLAPKPGKLMVKTVNNSKMTDGFVVTVRG